MASKFQLIEVDFQDYDSDSIGVSKDTYINGIADPQKTYNYGASTILRVAAGTWGDNHAILEIVMPEEEDIDGFGGIHKVELGLYLNGITASQQIVLGITELQEDFTEGEYDGAAGFCDWTDAQDTLPWTNGDGAIPSRYGATDDADKVIQTLRLFGSELNSFVKFDLTSVISMGDTKRFVIWIIGSTTADPIWDFSSREHGTSAEWPKLIVTNKSYPPDAFEGRDDALTIEPNPDNREQPLLKWGGVKDDDFVDFKVYRETAAITTVAFLTPIDTITSSADQEYIDDDALTDNQTYYYLVIAEDNDNILNNASWSNQIEWTKPDVTSVVLSDTGSQQVPQLETITVVSPQNIKKLFTDWDDERGGNGDIETWKEYETVGKTKTDTHIYSMSVGGVITAFANAGGGQVTVTSALHGLSNGDTVRIEGTTNYDGVRNVANVAANTFEITVAWVANETGIWVGSVEPSCRVEDELGFWSSLTGLTGTNVRFSDVNPTAKLRVSVKKETLGDNITLDGSLSQPAASNVTITKYEFKRDAGDGWQDNGTDPVYTFDSGTYPNSVGSKTASLRVTTSSAKTDTDTATYELETGTPTTLEFSNTTKIHELNHVLGQNKTVEIPIGSDGVEHEFLISRGAERVTLTGTSNHPNVGDDIGVIRSAWLNNTYCRIKVTTEMEDKTVYYNCKIDGDISLGHAYDNKQSWTFPIRVISRTEV